MNRDAHSSELLSIENNLRGYNADIVSKMARHFQGRRSVLEFGAGIGTLAIEWEKQTNVKPECVEIDLNRRQIIRDRGFKCYSAISEIAKRFEGIYLSNVLEHVEDDLGVLKELTGVMSDGAVLAVYVPAFRQLYTALDRSLGHRRRYRRAELIDKATTAGFELIDCHYVDCIGLLAWFFASLSNAARLRFYDKWLYPFSRTMDHLFMRPLAGKNLLLIARKGKSE